MRYTDPDGRESLLSELNTAISHPILATQVGRAKDGGSNISSIATNFTINLALPFANYGNAKEDQGSVRGAFRHCLWQTLITAKFDSEKAKIIGDGHDTPLSQLARPILYPTLEEADTVADQLNNIIGRIIGKEEKYEPKKLAKKVLDSFHETGLYTVVKEDNMYSVVRTKLSDDDYNKAIKIHKNLNNQGMFEK